MFRAVLDALTNRDPHQRALDDCEKGGVSERQRLKQCTEVLGRNLDPKTRSAVLCKRGALYYAMGMQYSTPDGPGHGNYVLSLADFSEAALLDPTNADAFRGRGNAVRIIHVINRVDEADLDKAILDFGTAIRLNEQDSESYYWRAYCFALKSDLDAAIADYTAAHSLNPAGLGSLRHRGDLFFQKGDLDHAIKDYSKAILLAAPFPGKWESDLIHFYQQRGKAYELRGELSLALADFEAVPKGETWSSVVESRKRLKSALDSKKAD